MPTTINPKVPYVLFADDDDDTLCILETCCKMRGWVGDFVKTPREIIAKVNENCNNVEDSYDAIVADINYFNQEQHLPRITGITAISQIREIYKNIPVIFISAYLSSLITKDIIDLGAESMSKPIDPLALFDRLEQLIKWNRLANRHVLFEDRRVNSVNFTAHRRRSTDRKVEIPQVIEGILNEIKIERQNK